MPRSDRWRRVTGVLLWVGCALQPTVLPADTDETRVLAAFTLNFAKFTEWPAERMANGQFTLCQLGGSERLALGAPAEIDVMRRAGRLERRLVVETDGGEELARRARVDQAAMGRHAAELI